MLLITSCTQHNPGDDSAPNTQRAQGQVVQLSQKLNIPVDCIQQGDSDLTNGEPDDSYRKVKTRWQQLNCRYANEPSRSLLVFLDGTGNNKKTSTNIWRMYDLALRAADQGMPVVPYYDQGVGNDKRSIVSGNVFGSGVSLNIRQAYRFLAQAYKPGDRIYLFGFSRGAFTARSLNGFIEFAGLMDASALNKDWGDDLPEWSGLSHLHRAVGDLYEIYFSRDTGAAQFEPTLRQHLKTFIADNHLPVRSVKVEAIGVFDTVPASGLLRDEEPDDHRLGLYARRGYHAMSLDEQRDDFRLQRFFAPLGDGQTLQEVWFAGVHADVGGGYGSPTLSRCQRSLTLPIDQQPIGLEATPLRWMLGNFAEDRIFATSPWPVECVTGRLHDEFLDSNGIRKRVFRLSGLIKRHPVSGDQVHGSVLCRMQATIAPHIRHELREPDGHYTPANLGDHPRQIFQFAPYQCP
ncbi:phospholipase effector Tle1 domain-containing protein [Pseudomonas putida]